MHERSTRRILLASFLAVGGCAEAPETSTAGGSPPETVAAEAPLSWVTVHEALSSGGVSLRVQATSRALDAVPNLADLTASEPVVAVVPGGGVVLDAAWAIAPQDTSLVDPWRIELTWDPDALTAEEAASLAVITEAAEGGWRRASVAEFSVRDGRAVVYASELGRVGLAAADIGGDVASFDEALPAPAQVAPAELGGELGEVIVDTLGDDKAIVDVLFRVSGLLPPANTACVSITGGGTFALPFKTPPDRYQRLIALDVPGSFEFTMFQSTQANCSDNAGDIWANTMEVIVAGYALPRASCTTASGPMNLNISAANSAIRGATATCPASTGVYSELVAFRLSGASPAVGGGNFVCVDVDGTTAQASNLGGGVYRYRENLFLPQTSVFRWWESTLSNCGDVVREFFPDNATVQVQSTTMPSVACIPRPGGDPGEVSFEVSLTTGPTVTVTGTETCASLECGNNVTQGDEECDDGNNDNDDGCTSDCLLEVCGDNVQQTGEDCDDGNVINGDGCSDTCVVDNLECYDEDVTFQGSGTLGSDDTSLWADRVSLSCGGSGRGDIAFLWQAPHPGNWTFDTFGSSVDTRIGAIAFSGGTCGSEVECSSAANAAVGLNGVDYEETFVIVVEGDAADGPVELNINAPAIPPQMTINGPDAADPRQNVRGGNFWNAGDNVTMIWTTSYASITGIEINLVISPNTLSLTRCASADPFQRVNVVVNGNTVGQLEIGPGDTLASDTFTFGAIAGPVYTVQLVTAANVGSGCGSAGYSNVGSTVTLIQ